MAAATAEFGGRVFSSETDEWMYVFEPRIGGIPLYIKVVLRAVCLVASFHEEGGDEDQV